MRDLNIEEIKISNDGYMWCKSWFYKIYVTLLSNDYKYIFKKGVNLIDCEIDSPEVGICYLMSMYNKVNKKLIFSEHCAYVNNQKISLEELSEHSCYIDKTNPFFAKRRTVRKSIEKGLKKSNSALSVEQIAEMFGLTDRIDRPLKANGNEALRAMCAIAFAYGKQIFCFSWFSKKYVEYYKPSLQLLLDVLEKEGKTVILPTSAVAELEDYDAQAEIIRAGSPR